LRETDSSSNLPTAVVMAAIITIFVFMLMLVIIIVVVVIGGLLAGGSLPDSMRASTVSLRCLAPADPFV
jgi:hypothetical protein